MAKPRMDLSTFVGKLLEEQDGDVLREGVRVLAQVLMDTEVTALVGAARVPYGPTRVRFPKRIRTFLDQRFCATPRCRALPEWGWPSRSAPPHEPVAVRPSPWSSCDPPGKERGSKSLAVRPVPVCGGRRGNELLALVVIGEVSLALRALPLALSGRRWCDRAQGSVGHTLRIETTQHRNCVGHGRYLQPV